jgi:L-threonylcarbamoyladenylate synthase
MPAILIPGPSTTATVAAQWRKRALVAFPTETVYGLGADATCAEAVQAIYDAKGRPSHNPLILHCASLAMVERIGVFGDTAYRLAATYWPGPLTLVLPLREGAGIAPAALAGGDTVALRIPAHPVARELLEAVDMPIAAPSANRSGRVSPTTAQHVAESLGDRVPWIVDGGPCPVGIESTVVEVLGGAEVTILRHGSITEESLRAMGVALVASVEQGGTLRSPGMLASHYAPSLPVRLNVTTPQVQEAWLGFGPEGMDATLNLSPSANLEDAARMLYAYLQLLDHPERYTGIAVMPIPQQGVGVAINDRLRRAAAQA